MFGISGPYVVDGSALPRSSRVNPSLSIYAWGLRVADLLAKSLRPGHSKGAGKTFAIERPARAAASHPAHLPQRGFLLDSAARSFCMDEGAREIAKLRANVQLIAGERTP